MTIKDHSTSDLFHEGKLLISPGDLLDKIAILSIKSVKLWASKDLNRTTLHEEQERLWQLWRQIILFYPPEVISQLREPQNRLYDINSEQWDWEDRVRTEKSWEAAVGARECNTRRVAVKNEINTIMEYPSEVKKYKIPEAKDELSDQEGRQQEVPEVPKL